MFKRIFVIVGLGRLRRMENKLSQLSDAIAANQTAIQAVTTAVTTLAADQAKAFTDLENKITAGGGVTADDLTAIATQTQSLNALATELQNLDSAATTADPGTA